VRRAGSSIALTAFLAAAALATTLTATAPARADGAMCGMDVPRVIAARSALAAARNSLPARLELADALVEATCYHEAVHVLEDGAKGQHHRNAELAARLRNARSLVTEQAYFEGKEQAELAAKLSRNLLRCTRLADLDACDEALKLKPDDSAILIAKGDALLKAGRAGEADAVARYARRLLPEDARVAAQLSAAAAQRAPLLERCRQGNDDPALQACQAALSKGADDEREILARMASLRQPRVQPARVAETAPESPAPTPAAGAAASAPLVAAVRMYSNAAEPSRSH
jgi:hypothetical protein